MLYHIILLLWCCRAEVGDFVVAPFNGSWYRGQVTTCNEQSAVIAYIDYGKCTALD